MECQWLTGLLAMACKFFGGFITIVSRLVTA